MKMRLGEILKKWAILLILVVGLLAFVGIMKFCQVNRDWVEVSTYERTEDHGIAVYACNPKPGKSELDVVIVNDSSTRWAYDGELYAISVHKLIDGKWYKCAEKNMAKTSLLYTIAPQSVELFEVNIRNDVGWLETGGVYRVSVVILGELNAYMDHTAEPFVIYDRFTVKGGETQ